MPRPLKKKVCLCDRHEFSLQPRGDYPSQPQHYQASYCMQPQQQPSPCLDCPTFNSDANYATPTFVLTSDKGAHQTQGQRLKEQHLRRMVNFTDQKSEINIPKPRSKNSFCSVCRHTYNDYLDHIDSQSHKKRIRNSDFNRHILQLSALFQNPRYSNRHHINRQTSTKISRVFHQKEPESVQIISNPHKKIKTNQPLTIPPIWNNRLPFSNSCLDQASMMNPYRPRQSFHSYNYNINMNMNLNLYLNMNQQAGINNYINPDAFNPYLNMQYQTYLYSQMNNLQPLNSSLFNRNLMPQEQRQGKPITYIIIDQ